MIQYKNGRLHIPGISFAIPEGFYFYTEVDSVSDNNLHFLSPDQSYSLNYQATSSLCGSPQKDLELMIRDTGSHPRQKPTPIIVNGLKGCYTCLIIRKADRLFSSTKKKRCPPGSVRNRNANITNSPSHVSMDVTVCCLIYMMKNNPLEEILENQL